MPRGLKGNGVGQGIGKGDGWGGPARGGGGRPARAFPKGDTFKRLPDTDEIVAWRAEKMARTVVLEQTLWELATASKREETRAGASVRLHAMWNGTPTATVDMTHAGPNGGPIQSVNVNTDDPIEAARAYQKLMGE